MARKKKAPDEEPTEPTPTAEQASVAVAEPSANGTHEANGQAEVKNRPVKTFSCPVSGATLEAAIWGKEIQAEGRTFTVYNVTISKSYKNDLGEWKHTNYLRGSELHVAVRLLSRCETWILDMRTEEDPPF